MFLLRSGPSPAVLLPFLLSSPALAQIRISSDVPKAEPGVLCTLHVAGGAAGRWTWTLDQPLGGRLEHDGGPTARFTAPQGTVAPRTIRIRARDARGESATVAIQLMPDPSQAVGRTGEFFRTMRLVLGEHWHLPQMTPFAGCGKDGGEVPPFMAIRGVHHVDDPAMGPLHKGFLVNDSAGLWRIQASGSRSRIAFKGQIDPSLPFEADPAGFPRLVCTAVATRPPGDNLGNPCRHPVVALRGTPSPGGPQRDFLCHLWPDGTLTPIAVDPAFRRKSAEGWETTWPFDEILHMVMDRRGFLYVADRAGRMVRIAPDGGILGLAGNGGRPSHPGDPGAWVAPGSVDISDRWPGNLGMAIDPDAGEVWVSTWRGIFRVHGESGRIQLDVHMVGAGVNRFDDGPRRTLPGIASPGGLHWFKGALYIADPDANCVGAFLPATRELWKVIEGRGRTGMTFGPLALYDAGVPEDTCASVAAPRWVCAHGEGCVVGTVDGFAHLDLPAGTFPGGVHGPSGSPTAAGGSVRFDFPESRLPGYRYVDLTEVKR